MRNDNNGWTTRESGRRKQVLLAATIVEKWTGLCWEYFISQLYIAGEPPKMPDEAFLEGCRREYPDLRLRVRPATQTKSTTQKRTTTTYEND